ncbi:MAG: glycosyltransferase [Sphaerochaetaceae bacterium]|nr:glycosyltransferase [Sphaerochaetaceae bacterium]
MTKLSQFHKQKQNKFDKWVKKNKFYHQDLSNFYKFNIPEKSSILEIGSKTGYLLNSLKPSNGVGVEFDKNLINFSQKKYSELKFFYFKRDKINLKPTFDYIIISDTLSRITDIQNLFRQIKQNCSSETRIIINYHSFLWLPLLDLAEKLHIKAPQNRTNWLTAEDVSNLLELENYQIIKTGNRFILPIYIPIISKIANRYFSHLPLFKSFCLTNYIIARPIGLEQINNPSVSVVIAARNEKGNIENAILRIPKLGKHTEIIFVEGGSTDGTWEEIIRISKKYSNIDIKYIKQDGKGKGDAVRKGFTIATGDILMILDADLTVPPEDLPKFYNAIASNKGEYINGSRLVYPMEHEAMRPLNIVGNKFFSVAFSWLLNQKIKDTLCGTKVISRKNYQILATNRKYFGEFDPFGDYDLIFGAAKMNLKFVEIPIRYKNREYGQTNISRFKHGWLLLRMVAFAMNKIKFIN